MDQHFLSQRPYPEQLHHLFYLEHDLGTVILYFWQLFQVHGCDTRCTSGVTHCSGQTSALFFCHDSASFDEFLQFIEHSLCIIWIRLVTSSINTLRGGSVLHYPAAHLVQYVLLSSRLTPYTWKIAWSWSQSQAPESFFCVLLHSAKVVCQYVFDLLWYVDKNQVPCR